MISGSAVCQPLECSHQAAYQWQFFVQLLGSIPVIPVETHPAIRCEAHMRGAAYALLS